MIAALVLLFGVVALTQMLTVGVTMNSFSRSGTNAATVAQNKMEELRRKHIYCLQPPATSCSDADLAAGEHTDLNLVVIANPDNSGEQINKFTVSWTVRVLDSGWQELPAGTNPNFTTIVEIDVRVVPQIIENRMNKMVVIHATLAPASNFS